MLRVDLLTTSSFSATTAAAFAGATAVAAYLDAKWNIGKDLKGIYRMKKMEKALMDAGKYLCACVKENWRALLDALKLASTKLPLGGYVTVLQVFRNGTLHADCSRLSAESPSAPDSMLAQSLRSPC